MSIRQAILSALSSDGGLMTLDDLADSTGEPRKRIQDNIGAALAEKLVERERDDVTGHPGYRITALGADRLNNPGGISKKTALENAIKTGKKRVDPDDQAEDRIDTIGQNGNDGLHYDPIARITELESDIRKQRALLEGKNEHIGYLTGQVEKLQADLDEAQRQLMRGATLTNSAQLRRPLAYAHVWADGFEFHQTEEEARADIERGFAQNALGESLLCAVLARANLKLTWSEA